MCSDFPQLSALTPRCICMHQKIPEVRIACLLPFIVNDPHMEKPLASFMNG